MWILSYEGESPAMPVSTGPMAVKRRIPGIVTSCYVRFGAISLNSAFIPQPSVNSSRSSSWYYLRVEQEDGNIAWSSPIWITKGE